MSQISKRRKFRHEVMETSFENLSNELFYVIFDYIDGWNLYQAFSNLNIRFQRLIHSSCLYFKVRYNSSTKQIDFLDQWKSFITQHRSQIFSLRLSNSSSHDEILSLFTIDSTFDHLQSLNIFYLNADLLLSLLANLSLLPCLFSLVLDMDFETTITLNQIYQFILNLPHLKSYRFYMSDNELALTLPILVSQSSSIEYLNLSHYGTFDDLEKILCHTPLIRCLKFHYSFNPSIDPIFLSDIRVDNLTYLSLKLYDVKFDHFERFIRKLTSNITNLYLNTQSEDPIYLHAYRWEQLINEYLPKLKKFCLQYDEYVVEDRRPTVTSEEIQRFSSAFWIDRQWRFESEIELDHIFYFICSYRKRWYDDDDDELINHSKSTRLILSFIENDLTYDYIKHISKLSMIYHLEILIEISLGVLFEILHLLPELDSLKIVSISMENINDLDLIKNYLMRTYKLTKIYNEDINIYLLLYFPFIFQSMIYFKTNSIDKRFLEIIVKYALKPAHQYNKNFRLLSFSIDNLDEKMMKSFGKMIEKRRLSYRFHFKRIFDRLFLSWM